MRRALLMIVIMMLIGCNSNSERGGMYSTTTSDVSLDVKPTVSSNYYKTPKDPVEIYLDDLSFREAFHIQHLVKGEGHTFWWHGNEYTTNLLVSVKESKYPSVDAE